MLLLVLLSGALYGVRLIATADEDDEDAGMEWDDDEEEDGNEDRSTLLPLIAI